MGADFTIMAILGAQDRASAVVDRVARVVDKFREVLDKAATDAEAAGTVIDQSLLQTASGADALALANDRIAASESKVALATREQAAAEQLLMEARASGAGDTELIAGLDLLSKAERDAAKASAELKTAQEAQIKVTQALETANSGLTDSEGAAAAASTGWIGIALAAAVGVAAAGALSVSAAGDFQSLTTHLVTDAGEASKQLGYVSKGLLQVAEDTGTSADKIAQGMYHIESSGFHGKAGIDMVTVAAEGAKVGGADIDTVAKTLAGSMDAFKEKGYSAVQMMNMLIETTAQGDLRMQDLVTSLGAVAPIAAKAGMDFSQVGGAIATMTSQNMTAQQATQNLANLISHLSNPINTQRQAMQSMGIDINDLTSNLGSRGLTGTIAILTKAIDDNTHSGGVFINTLNDSNAAAADSQRMISLMTPDLAKLSKQLVDGSISVKDYTKAFKDMGPEQAKQGSQFLTLNERMGGFNKLLASGSPEAETFNAAMAQLTGGQVGLRTALMLSGTGAEYFNTATAAIQATADKAGGSVKNWDTIQGTFNQKLDQLKASFDVLGIKIGTVILPYIEKLMAVFAVVAEWMMHNKTVVMGLAIALGVSLAAALVVISVLTIGAMAVLSAMGLVLYGLWEAAKYVWKALVAAWRGLESSAKDLWHAMESVWHSIVSGVESAWNYVASVTERVWNKIYAFFAKWWALIVLVFATPIALLMGAWNRTHEFFESTSTRTWNAISKFFSEVWGKIASVASSAWRLVKDNILHPIDEARHDLERYLSSIWKSVTDTFSSVNKWLGGVLKDFEDFGSNIVRGIIKGVKDNARELKDELGNLAEGALKFAKGVIQVGSPSRRFADEVGKWIPYGIAAGVKEHAHVARDAVGSMAGSLPKSAEFGAGFGLSAVSGAGGGLGGGAPSVVIDMRGSQLMSNQDMDVFADRVGKRIANRILPAGGVRIRA